jgi:4-diphosphocytidyl-2C-methyl-D-erythritol kinase
VLLEKSKRGDVNDCEIVAFVERTAFGEDRGEDVVVMKSPEAKRFVLVLHPTGSSGGEAESNRSTYEEGAT